MYSNVQVALKYILYYLTASNGKGHGIHSPFVFDFIKNVLNDKTPYADYSVVEKLRKKSGQDSTIISVDDFGAGSAVHKSKQRSVASIIKNSVKSRKYGQLLFRMVKKYPARTILELGTSLGITSSYLALANPDAEIITLEGSSAVAQKAMENFDYLKLHNIKLVQGNFEETLSTVISGLPAVDIVFIDGNHQKEPVERYFRQLIDKINNDSILIFDDIHWSREMEEAWKTIQHHASVRCTIDLFFMGIVFFRQEFKEKQNFKIRF